MSKKDLDFALNYLDYKDESAFLMRWSYIIWHLEDEVKELTPDETEILKKRLIECRDLIFDENENHLEFMQRVRKKRNFSKDRLWWWLDEL